MLREKWKVAKLLERRLPSFSPRYCWVSCECCGTSEECTPTYISRVKEKFYGKWLCGLCSEAVQEKKRKYRTFSNEQALEAHMNICKQFNMGTRIHPELSLADAVISFTRKRSQLRDPAGSFTPQQQMERSCICPISNKA